MKNMTWSYFFEIITNRVREPRSNPGFWIYFLLNIIIVGGFGMWYSIGAWNFDDFLLSGATYFLALISTSSVEFGLKEFTPYKEYNTSFKHLSYFLLILGIILFFCTQIFAKVYWLKFIILLIGVSISWMLWWITNSDNTLILGTQPSLSQIAGDDEKVEGDLNDIQY